MKKLFFIACLFLFVYTTCKEENIKYTYYKNGKLKEKTDYDNNIIFSYYESGKIKFIADIKRDKLHGKIVSYYENGIVEDSGYYNNDNQFGTWYYYNKSGLLDKVCNYAFFEGRGNLLNEIVFFDENGDTILNKGHHFRIEAGKDTISLNDTFKFEVIIEVSFFNDSSGVLIADFDSIYNFIDTASIINFDGNDNKIKCSIGSNKIGENIIRGIIYDHTIRNDSDLYRELFFTKKYYVKPLTSVVYKK